MKTFKRNVVIITIIVFVCAAAYLNWSYGKQTETDAGSGETTAQLQELLDPASDGLSSEDGPEKAGLVYDGTSHKPASAYFAEARLKREQARDAAVETLSTVQKASGASQEIIDNALKKITDIASYAQTETELEALIKAKSFEDCVVFISDNKVNVTVSAPEGGLKAPDVAKITEIIVTETAFSALDINIIGI